MASPHKLGFAQLEVATALMHHWGGRAVKAYVEGARGLSSGTNCFDSLYKRRQALSPSSLARST